MSQYKTAKSTDNGWLKSIKKDFKDLFYFVANPDKETVLASIEGLRTFTNQLETKINSYLDLSQQDDLREDLIAIKTLISILSSHSRFIEDDPQSLKEYKRYTRDIQYYFNNIVKILTEQIKPKAKEPERKTKIELSEWPESNAFSMYGMKVVIQDSNITPETVKAYINQIDKAYQYLKAKKLEKAWYGIIFIQPHDPTLKNKNTGRSGELGGSYHFGRDVISLSTAFPRNSSRLIIHELGHRYWYKSLTQAQREKFKDIIWMEKEKREEYDRSTKKFEWGNFPIQREIEIRDPSILSDIESLFSNIDSEIDKLKVLGEELKFSKNTSEYQSAASKIGQAYFPVKYKIHPVLKNIKDQGVNSGIFHVDEPKAYFRGNLQETTKQQLGITPYQILNPDVSFAPISFVPIGYFSDYSEDRELSEEYRQQKADQFLTGLEEWRTNIKNMLQWLYSKLATTSFEQESKPKPVSDYGKSNISEAFAEAFCHYVLEKDMSRDQIDSFKSVINMYDTKLSNLSLDKLIKLADLYYYLQTK